MSAEAKVGLLVIVTAVLALAVAVFLSDALRNLNAYTVTVRFADVQGLRRGSPVTLFGKSVGEVTDVEIRPDPDFPARPVAVDVSVRDEILYASDVFEIKQGSLVGDRYLAISRPHDAKQQVKLKNGDVVGGSGVSSAEVIMDEAQRLIVAAREAVEAANLVLADAETQENLKHTVANLRAATERAVLITDKVVRVVDTFGQVTEANDKRVAAIMANLISASDDVQKTVEQVQRMVQLTPVPAQVAAAGENIRVASEDLAAIAQNARERVEQTTIDQRIEEAIATLQEASENLQQMTQSAAELTGDEQVQADVRATVSNVREASESLKATSEHAERLLGDEQMTEDLRAAIHSLRETAEASTGTMERAGSVLTDIENTLVSVRETQELVTQIQSRTRLQVRAAKRGGLRADAALDLRLDPEKRPYWRAGVRDFGDAERLDLQYTEAFGPGWLRAGLFGNKLGMGYDWEYAGDRAVEMELYDPDDVRLDLWWRLAVRREYGLLLGLEQALDEGNPIIGVRYQTDF
ncbi:MAG: MlaD family protein [Armatimonadota bacterium]